jgi:hypothetical protein
MNKGLLDRLEELDSSSSKVKSSPCPSPEPLSPNEPFSARPLARIATMDGFLGSARASYESEELDELEVLDALQGRDGPSSRSSSREARLRRAVVGSGCKKLWRGRLSARTKASDGTEPASVAEYRASASKWSS